MPPPPVHRRWDVRFQGINAKVYHPFKLGYARDDPRMVRKRKKEEEREKRREVARRARAIGEGFEEAERQGWWDYLRR